jgi:hypothetical protein
MHDGTEAQNLITDQCNTQPKITHGRGYGAAAIGLHFGLGLPLLTTDATMRRTASESVIQAPSASASASATASSGMPPRRFIS